MCGKIENLHSCTGCFQRQYCSPECQKEAWPEHNAICEAWKYVGLHVTDPEEVAYKLSLYTQQLGDSNLRESQLRVSLEVFAFCKAFKLMRETLGAISNVASTLEHMGRHPEAEIFAREMVTESEKHTPIQDVHVQAVSKLCTTLFFQNKFEESRRLAHDGVERFRPLVQKGEALARLMEAESVALGVGLHRHDEALVGAYIFIYIHIYAFVKFSLYCLSYIY
jgi:hypothetical protein